MLSITAESLLFCVPLDAFRNIIHNSVVMSRVKSASDVAVGERWQMRHANEASKKNIKSFFFAIRDILSDIRKCDKS